MKAEIFAGNATESAASFAQVQQLQVVSRVRATSASWIRVRVCVYVRVYDAHFNEYTRKVWNTRVTDYESPELNSRARPRNRDSPILTRGGAIACLGFHDDNGRSASTNRSAEAGNEKHEKKQPVAIRIFCSGRHESIYITLSDKIIIKMIIQVRMLMISAFALRERTRAIIRGQLARRRSN